ncbi:MAG TPA: hypothetical protein DCP28_14605 [Cytophagales bacterium]|nr:hypothetical protein [Cytophagales bacterium]
MESLSLQNRYELKELELNALLEVTQAINNNLNEDSLYKIYNFTLRANLSLRKLALYVLDENWACKVNFGTKANFQSLDLPSEFISIKKATPLQGVDSPFGEFDNIIPVAHKNQRLAFVYVGGLYSSDDEEISRSGINFIQALSNIIMVAIENKKLARKQLRQEALRKELEIAHQVQKYLIPKSLPSTEALQIAALYLPHDKVGGDYYDYLPLEDGRFVLCIADVSGKGIPAALLMSNFQASLRTLAKKTDDLVEMVETLNHQTYDSARGDNFITVFLCLYDPSNCTLSYINAGHNPPIFIQEGKGQLLESGTTILGAFKSLPFISPGFLENADSSLLALYTDGVTEIENAEEEQFGPERLQQLLEEQEGESNLGTLNDRLMEALDAFREDMPYNDDITLVTCRITA